jgi:hypothetical protein
MECFRWYKSKFIKSLQQILYLARTTFDTLTFYAVGGQYILSCFLIVLFSLICRCLEEGAEDFLLKPVKLSDVRRLKDFIMRGEVKDGEKCSLKRMRSSDDCSPSLSTTFSPMCHSCDPPSSVFSPLSPSTLSSKKSRLWSDID